MSCLVKDLDEMLVLDGQRKQQLTVSLLAKMVSIEKPLAEIALTDFRVELRYPLEDPGGTFY